MIYRFDVSTRPDANGIDSQGVSVARQAQQFGIDVGVTTAARVYFIDTEEAADRVERAAYALLSDPVVENIRRITTREKDVGTRLEIHLKPGVTDPVASSTEMALRDAGLNVTAVRTGKAYVFTAALTPDALQTLGTRVLANTVVETAHYQPLLPTAFATASGHAFELRHVALRALNDDQLKKLSRDGHLFLSLTEMKAVQEYFIERGREPTDIELETLAQTWSEHCVHKTLKSRVEVYDESGAHLRTYDNLIKETIFGSTMELIRRRNDGFCLSVFKDNAGVIAFDDTDAVCFKVETHNRPSALEPYGGAATGIGGCIRDVLGTGLGAKPIANTNVFCVAYPDRNTDSPAHRLTDLPTHRLTDSPLRLYDCNSTKETHHAQTNSAHHPRRLGTKSLGKMGRFQRRAHRQHARRGRDRARVSTHTHSHFRVRRRAAGRNDGQLRSRASEHRRGAHRQSGIGRDHETNFKWRIF